MTVLKVNEQRDSLVYGYGFGRLFGEIVAVFLDKPPFGFRDFQIARIFTFF
jgi:hypothetical protein